MNCDTYTLREIKQSKEYKNIPSGYDKSKLTKSELCTLLKRKNPKSKNKTSKSKASKSKASRKSTRSNKKVSGKKNSRSINKRKRSTNVSQKTKKAKVDTPKSVNTSSSTSSSKVAIMKKTISEFSQRHPSDVMKIGKMWYNDCFGNTITEADPFRNFSPDAQLYVMYKDGEPIATGAYSNSGFWNFCSATSQRRQGNMERVIKYMERDIKNTGQDSVHLYVYKTNQSAINLYHKLGYVVESETEDAYRMEKKL